MDKDSASINYYFITFEGRKGNCNCYSIVIVGYLLHSVQHPPGNISEFSRRVVFSYFLEEA